MRENGFLLRFERNYNQPSQMAISRGFLVYTFDADHDAYEIKVTPLGVNYFINFFTCRRYEDNNN